MAASSAPIRLRSQKGLLTRYCNNLDEIIARCEGENTLKMLSSSSSSDDFERIASVVYELKARTQLLSNHLATFASTIDSLENSHIAIDGADRLAIELEAKHMSVREKFNYREYLVKRYPVIEENYVLAIDFMKKKVRNKTELVRVLQKRLDNARSEKPSTQAQKKLPEYIIPLMMQLHKVEVNLDGSCNAQKLLPKFASRIQRKVLEDFVTLDMPENAWMVQSIVDALDAHIATEERVSSMNCMFCGSPEHRTASCSRYCTITERRNF
ncbi:hypothetical protein OSTOST_00868 [Ostertagia ostertagi]